MSSVKNFDDYLLEEIKDDPELATAYAKASVETKEYIDVIDRQRQLIKELVEDGERLIKSILESKGSLSEAEQEAIRRHNKLAYEPDSRVWEIVKEIRLTKGGRI